MDPTENEQGRRSSDAENTGNETKNQGYQEAGGESKKASDNEQTVGNKWVHNQNLNAQPLRELLNTTKEGVESLIKEKKAELLKYQSVLGNIKRG